jgi:alpha-ribazole phosphatase
MTRVWLIRHGEPLEGEISQRCYGSLDIGLSEQGRAQMRWVAEYLKDESISAIYTSPLSRALESARLIAPAATRPIEALEDLREIDFGDFEGLSYDEIASRFPDLFKQWMETPTEVRFPHGECFSQMHARVLEAFRKIHCEREDQTIAIVSHGGVNRILIAWALNMPGHSVFRLAQDFGAVSLMTFADGIPSIQLMNFRPAIWKS